MKKIHSTLLGAIAVTLLCASPALAHEAHQENMTDAEMAQMQAEMPIAGHVESMINEQSDGHVDIHVDRQGGEHSAMSEDVGIELHDIGAGMAASEMHAGAVTQNQSPEEAMMAAREANRVESPTDLLGRFHPVLAHFPIALLLLAAFTELALMFRPALGVEPTIRFLVAGGAIGAVAAALLGWFAAGWRLVDRSETLGVHRWTGSGIALVSLFAMWLAFRGGNRTALRVTLAVLAAAIVVQGYYGGEMVFGPNHMGMF